jgi:hypothetical protein
MMEWGGFLVNDSNPESRGTSSLLSDSTALRRHLPGNLVSMSAVLRSAPATALVLILSIMTAGCHARLAPKTATFFPESNEAPGWTKGETRTFEAGSLWEYIDGDAERYLQAGVQKTLTSDYRYREKIEAAADVYVMTDPEGARKIFDSESAAGSHPVNLGDAGHSAKGSVTFRKGSFFVRIVAYQDSPEVGEALETLGRAIERRLDQK